MDFSLLPISKPLVAGLKMSNYSKMTPVQELTIKPTLTGKDYIVASKTGSGKTLCFLIPLLDALEKLKTSRHDGLVALVLTPTRELALQIFNVLRKIGKKFDFSAGLLIGGNNISYEKGNITFMNILICTPGRLLQHLDQTPLFSADNLKMLVIDECDRVLDMGFKKQLEAIIEHLPNKEHNPRQTLLYSATVSSEIVEIAKTHMNEPETLKCYDLDSKTPSQLNQRYMVVEANTKLDFIWSYIKSHLNSKSMLFFTTCKQVRFVFEAFRQLRPGVPLMHIHGAMKQQRRLENYAQFMHSNKAVLFCTDVASRGLDFTGVDWIVQVDCPENADQYVHRVGRSARHLKGGNALLLLVESELHFLTTLKDISIKEIKVNKEKQLAIAEKLASVLVEHKELKTLAYSYFTSYASAIYKATDKQVFQFDLYPWESIAMHLGLHAMPIISFRKRKPKMEFQQFTDMLEASMSLDHASILNQDTKKPLDPIKAQKRLDNDDFLTLAPANQLEEEPETVFITRDTNKNLQMVQKMSKRQIMNAKQKEIKKRKATRIVFNEDGEPEQPFSTIDNDNLPQLINENITSKVLEMKEADLVDKLKEKERKKQEKYKKKRQLDNSNDMDNPIEVVVGSPLKKKSKIEKLTLQQQEELVMQML